MTLYLSRNAATPAVVDGTVRSGDGGGAIAGDRIATSRTDPPLFTHVWQRLFEQSARKERRR